jgi:hypothetical protein
LSQALLNLEWDLIRIARRRRSVLRPSAEDARVLRGSCARREAGAFIQWLGLFAWTFDPRLPEGQRHQPFVPWPIQVRAGSDIWKAIREGRDVLIDKSRDMGASWLCLAAFAWWWLFVPDTPLLAASRKEDFVDAGGNPDCLFWKIDYLLSRLPSWMRPRTERRHMHLANLDNGSVIDGEATNPDLGRGGRRKAILLDEFAAVENAGEILAATADATPCRIYNSTPKGRANAFAEVRFSSKAQVITLHWKEHPVKGKGARLITAPDGKQRWTSPWYEAECARRTSRKEVAQEIDIDYLASGDAFFDLDVLQRIRASGQLRPPTAVGDLDFRVDTVSEGRSYRLGPVSFRENGGSRRLQIWVPLVNGRPLQNRRYAGFADIGHGTGSSNSVVKFADVNTREEVCSCATADLSPDAFADFCVALATWLGGESPAFLGWEANGPGGIFGRRVWRLGYGAVLGNADLTIPWTPEDSKIGWYSSGGPNGQKALLLGELRGALARGELTLHDEATIVEAERYIVYPSGTPGPSDTVEETEGARAAHGDRVIAAAGLILSMGYCALARKPPPVSPPVNSYAWRRREFLRREREQELDRW